MQTVYDAEYFLRLDPERSVEEARELAERWNAPAVEDPDEALRIAHIGHACEHEVRGIHSLHSSGEIDANTHDAMVRDAYSRYNAKL